MDPASTGTGPQGAHRSLPRAAGDPRASSRRTPASVAFAVLAGTACGGEDPGFAALHDAALLSAVHGMFAEAAHAFAPMRRRPAVGDGEEGLAGVIDLLVREGRRLPARRAGSAVETKLLHRGGPWRAEAPVATPAPDRPARVRPKGR